MRCIALRHTHTQLSASPPFFSLRQQVRRSRRFVDRRSAVWSGHVPAQAVERVPSKAQSQPTVKFRDKRLVPESYNVTNRFAFNSPVWVKDYRYCQLVRDPCFCCVAHTPFGVCQSGRHSKRVISGGRAEEFFHLRFRHTNLQPIKALFTNLVRDSRHPKKRAPTDW